MGFSFFRTVTAQAFLEFSETFEVGPVTSSFQIGDPNFNNIFCEPDVIANGGVFIDGSASFGGTEYRVDICAIDPNSPPSCYAWNTSGWIEGQPGVINLLDIWQMNHPTWELWGGYDYHVTLALKKPGCTGWEALREDFTIIMASSGCRLTAVKDSEIKVYPNPSTDQIYFSGIKQTAGNPIPFRIIDLTGRQVVEDQLTSPHYPIDVSDLPPGVYVAVLDLEGQKVSKRFSVHR